MKKLISITIGLFFSLVCLVSFSSAMVLSNIEDESPDVWDIDINNEYIPQKGGIKVCKAENVVIVGFYLSDDNIDFYKQTFSDGRRKLMGFEIDIIDHSGVFDSDDLEDVQVYGFFGNLRYDDNYQSDSVNKYTLAINDPSKLTANRWYTATFPFKKHSNVDVAKYEVQVQSVGDVYSLKNDFEDRYDRYGSFVKSEFAGWFLAKSDSDGNNFFNIRPPRESLFSQDRFLWYMGGEGKGQIGDFEPYYCGFGSEPDWSKGESYNNEGVVDSSGNAIYPLPVEEVLHLFHRHSHHSLQNPTLQGRFLASRSRYQYGAWTSL